MHLKVTLKIDYSIQIGLYVPIHHQACTDHILYGAKFRGSLILQIFNCSQKYFNKNFDTQRAVCAREVSS